jgi:hypothetical protein
VGKVKLIGNPSNISDDEVFCGATVRSMTWQEAANMANYLNFFARRIVPFTSFGVTGNVGPFEFLFPVSDPDYSTRKLFVMCLIGSGTLDYAAGAIVLDVSGTTQSSALSATFAEGKGNTTFALTTEMAKVYVNRLPQISGGVLEKMSCEITTASPGRFFLGYGAWELPPNGTGIAKSSKGGYLSAKASITDTVDNVVDPTDFAILEAIDTDVDVIQNAATRAWYKERRIVQNCGYVDTSAGDPSMILTTATTSAWTTVSDGGFYIPPYATRKDETTRNIRVVVHFKNTAAGTGQWRVVTSQGNSSSDSVANQTLQWRPCSDGSGNFDSTGNGLQVSVGTAGEWIDIQIYHEGADPEIYQVQIWEDEPT